MLSDEQIAKCLRATLPRTKYTTGYVAFARVVEHEATSSLIEQINEDEALMRQALIALYSGPRDDGSFTPEYRCAIEALRQRLKDKK